MSNVQKLKDAGCIHPDADLHAAEEKVINELTDNEMQALMEIRNKLGTAYGDQAGVTERLKPNVFV